MDDILNDTIYFSKYVLKQKYNFCSSIPLIVHQTWISHNLPVNMRKNLVRNKNINNELEFILYDDTECREFIKQNYTDTVLYAYDKLKPGAYKADLWRLCVLYIKGGFYMDIKLCCSEKFKLVNLAKKEHLVLDMPQNKGTKYEKYGIYNAFMISRKFNPFIKKAIKLLCINVMNNGYNNNPLAVTGPLFLSNVIKEFNYLKRIMIDMNHYREELKYVGQPLSERLGVVSYNDENIITCEYNGYLEDRSYSYKKINTKHYDSLWKARDIYYSYKCFYNIFNPSYVIVNYYNNQAIFYKPDINRNIIFKEGCYLLYVNKNNDISIIPNLLFANNDTNNVIDVIRCQNISLLEKYINYYIETKKVIDNIDIVNTDNKLTSIHSDNNSIDSNYDSDDEEDIVYYFKLRTLLKDWIETTAQEIRNMELIESDSDSENENLLENYDYYKNLLQNVEHKPETKPETKPKTKPETKPETKTKTKPETKPKAKPEAKTKTKTKTETDYRLINYFNSIISRSQSESKPIYYNTSNKVNNLTIKNNEANKIITSLYKEVLYREPDDGGLKHWVDKYNNGMSKESIKHVMMNSKEGKNVREYINRKKFTSVTNEYNRYGFIQYGK